MNDKKGNFPKGIYYILGNIFLDRLSSGGFIVILAIYLHQKLEFDINTATALYHINEFLLYFFTIAGAIIAENFLGVYRTLIIMTLICALGSATMSIASFELPFLSIRFLSIIGLLVTMIGMGCIKSNQNVFGGNQFKLPEQEKMLNYYFSMHYFVLKCGQVGGMILAPILREDYKCFGKNDCYPLAFGFTSFLMILALSTLWIGRKSYIHIPPSGNMVMKVLRCIYYSLKMKIRAKEKDFKVNHWLDWSEQKYGSKLLRDTKIILNVLIIYLPLPLYWSLIQQQSSKWIFQATRMNGDIGWYTIKPDQIVVFGPMLITFLIPLFNEIIFPFLEKIGIKSTLQKMSCGMICAALSFFMSAFVELKISNSNISIIWLIPQYTLVAISEVLLWVANINFAYTQAPQSMKSVMTATVYMTVAFGSFIVFLISGLNLFTSQVYEFLFYAFLMIIDTVIFGVLAVRYKYIELETYAINNNKNINESDA